MNQGELVMNGTPQEVFSREEELLSAGLDLPEAAKLARQLRAQGMEVPAGIIRYDQMLCFLKKKLGGEK